MYPLTPVGRRSVVSTQPNCCRTQVTTALYPPFPQLTCSRGNRPRTRSNNVLAPSRSCTSAGSTTKPQMSPNVSTNRCRLRPPIFFSRVVALGTADFRGLDRLAIHYGGAGRRLTVLQLSQTHPENVVDLFQQPGIAPGVEVVAHQAPRGESRAAACARSSRCGPCRKGR